MPVVHFQTSDMEIFEVDLAVAKCFGTIKNMLDNWCIHNDPGPVIPLMNVNGTILRKILTWAYYHKNDPEPIAQSNVDEYEKRTDDICSWDLDFMDIDKDTIFEMTMAANYLDVKGLYDLCCKTIANLVKGETPDQIRNSFCMKNDEPPTEEANGE